MICTWPTQKDKALEMKTRMKFRKWTCLYLATDGEDDCVSSWLVMLFSVYDGVNRQSIRFIFFITWTSDSSSLNLTGCPQLSSRSSTSRKSNTHIRAETEKITLDSIQVDLLSQAESEKYFSQRICSDPLQRNTKPQIQYVCLHCALYKCLH